MTATREPWRVRLRRASRGRVTADPIHIATRQRRRERRRATIGAGGHWLRTKVLPVLASLLGLVCASIAAFTVSATIGWAVTAIALWLLEWRVRG